jgi:hypothetical protein
MLGGIRIGFLSIVSCRADSLIVDLLLLFLYRDGTFKRMIAPVLRMCKGEGAFYFRRKRLPLYSPRMAMADRLFRFQIRDLFQTLMQTLLMLSSPSQMDT